jgi:hypothetical protein
MPSSDGGAAATTVSSRVAATATLVMRDCAAHRRQAACGA